MIDSASPSAAEVLGKWFQLNREDLHTALPARVESYDAASNRCRTQPLIKRRRVDGAGHVTVIRRGVVVNVPVLWPGGGGTSITCPLAVGDTVLLVFCEASLDAWLAGEGGEVDPQDDRRHAFSDGIAIPVLSATPLATGTPPSDAIAIDGGGARIEVDRQVAAIGGRLGAQPTLLGTTYQTELGVLLTAFETFVGAIGAHVAPSGPSPDPTLASACTAFATAIGAFVSTMPGQLTLIARVV